MTEPTVAEEHYAKLIAFWHGQKLLYRKPDDGGVVTVANSRGIRWSYDGEWMDRYVQQHWREYLAAASAVIETTGT